MERMRARVLDVGNCDPDHGRIRGMLEQHFDVEIHRVMFVDEAIEAMKRMRYELVLVNRLIFADSSPGIELHRRAKSDGQLSDIAIMMISNYPEAHSESVAAGGVHGFGKARVYHPETIERLSKHLPRRSSKSP